jgi:hypothetical protein
MNWRSFATVTVAAATVAGCDKIPVEKIPFIGKKLAPTEQAAPEDSLATEQQGDSVVAEGQTEAEASPAEAAQTPVAEPAAPTQRATRPPAQVAIIGEEPWFPTATGTVSPGMTEDPQRLRAELRHL